VHRKREVVVEERDRDRVHIRKRDDLFIIKQILDAR
jgi:hypothetical protein